MQDKVLQKVKAKYIFVKPVEGGIVRDPVTMQIVPKEGKKVRLDKYWQRRIDDKDVNASELPSNDKGE